MAYTANKSNTACFVELRQLSKAIWLLILANLDVVEDLEHNVTRNVELRFFIMGTSMMVP